MSVIWITGARGFIGRHLARHLESEACKVFGLGRGSWSAEEARSWGVSLWMNGSVTAQNLRSLMRETSRPDAIYHLAGGASVGASIENPRVDFVNTVNATSELLDWVRRESPETHLVAVSSAAVYGASHEGAIRETDVIRPYSPYGYHKHLMEELCRCYARQYGIRIVIVRLFSVYGKYLRKQLLWDLCGKLKDNCGPVILGGSGRELRDWTDIRDVVEALPFLIRRADDRAPTYNIGTGIGTAVSDIASMVGNAWSGTVGDCARVEFSGEARKGDPFALVADTSQADDAGIKIRIDVMRGIRDYVQWFRSTYESRR